MLDGIDGIEHAISVNEQVCDRPAAFLAATVNRYSCPLVNPEAVTCLALNIVKY
jgi:hypothetical protein